MAVEVVAHLELVNFEQEVWNLRWHYHSEITAKNFKDQGHLLIHGDICMMPSCLFLLKVTKKLQKNFPQGSYFIESTIEVHIEHNFSYCDHCLVCKYLVAI